MLQEEALQILKTGVNVFLTGEPGSGKTHTINRYIAWLQERGVEPSVTASTGIAATHVNGMTIHSWSGIGIKRSISEWDIEMIMSKEKTAKRILDAKVLIIDEISMLDATTLDNVDRVLRNIRRGVLEESKPFGGLQVIFVGDFFQLPPIAKQGQEAQFAFEAESWKAANPLVCYLAEQHRQEDETFLSILNALRKNELEESHKVHLRKRANAESKSGAITRLFTHNADVDRINAANLEEIQGVSKVYYMTARGSATLIESLKNSCLSPEVLTLKIGAAVMFTRNNFEGGYVNGTLGEVINFTPLGSPIVKTKRGTVITVEPAEWAIQDGAKILAKVSQIPLRLAWAITVHKSQGMSLDAAVIDLSHAFEYGQGYVAISRVRTLAGLFLEGLNARAFQLHPKILSYDSRLRAASEAARNKFASFEPKELQKFEAQFMRAVGGKAPSEVQAKIKKEPKPKGTGFDEIRKTHKNAFARWTNQDDSLLTSMFKEKKTRTDMAEHFGRKPSAITARLAHLGLIPNEWKGYKKKA